MSRLLLVTPLVFIVSLTVHAVGVSALLPICTDEFAASTSCWANSKCILMDNCDVPDPDPDKSCTEENEMLDEAAACCSSCTATVEAIRECRGCSASTDATASPVTTVPPPAPTTEIDTTIETEELGDADTEDDPSTLLKPCTDEMSAVTVCYASNKCNAVPDCDAYDPDLDKTCVEEEEIANEFQQCCSACSGEAQAVLSCRCSGDSTENVVEEDATNVAGSMGVNAFVFGMASLFAATCLY